MGIYHVPRPLWTWCGFQKGSCWCNGEKMSYIIVWHARRVLRYYHMFFWFILDFACIRIFNCWWLLDLWADWKSKIKMYFLFCLSRYPELIRHAKLSGMSANCAEVSCLMCRTRYKKKTWSVLFLLAAMKLWIKQLYCNVGKTINHPLFKNSL